jgi:hypothetical protein
LSSTLIQDIVRPLHFEEKEKVLEMEAVDEWTAVDDQKGGIARVIVDHVGGIDRIR